jgi:hypothetical protein
MLEAQARVWDLMHGDPLLDSLANTVPAEIDMSNAVIGLQELAENEEVIAPEALLAKVQQD